MVVARQEPPQAARSSYFASQSSYYASLYSAAQASQSASGTYDDDDDQDTSSSGYDDKTGSDFSTAIALAFGSTTATLENTATTTESISYDAAQSQTSEGTITSESIVQSTTTPSMTTSYSWTQPAWRPGWRSYTPSYISTATSSETSAASLTPGLDTQEKAHHGPNTTIIAGIVIPIVILLASGLVALTCLRRRRKRATVSGAGDVAVAGAATPIAMAEKAAEKKPIPGVHHTTHTTILSPIDEATAAPQLPQLLITSRHERGSTTTLPGTKYVEPYIFGATSAEYRTNCSSCTGFTDLTSLPGGSSRFAVFRRERDIHHEVTFSKVIREYAVLEQR
ncbi:hypothetical protein KCU62_g9649, partial [Aureobasidium sp. EXF-3399]